MTDDEEEEEDDRDKRTLSNDAEMREMREVDDMFYRVLLELAKQVEADEPLKEDIADVLADLQGEQTAFVDVILACGCHAITISRRSC